MISTIPTRKISETILEFADPYLALVGNFSTQEFEEIMHIIVCAWNVVVIDKENKTNKYEKMFLESLSTMPPESDALKHMPKALIERKKKKYSSDPRAVRNYQVIEKNSQLVFKAEACLDLKKFKITEMIQ